VRFPACIALLLVLAASPLARAQAPTEPATGGEVEGAEQTPEAVGEGSGAAPSDDERARQLYRHGDRLYAQGNYEEAANAFEQAYALSERPLLLFNLANAYERQGAWARALQALRRYSPHADERDAKLVQSRIAYLERRLATATDSAPLSAEPRRENSPPKPAASEADADSSAATQPPNAKPSGAEAANSSSLLGLAVLIGGASIVAGGGVLWALSAAESSKIDERCSNEPGHRICRTSADGPLDKEHSYALAGDIAMSVGVLTAGIGLWLLLARDEKLDGKSAGAGSATLQARRGGALLQWSGHF